MKLYHYTTFTNFCSIWIQQKLNFSEWTNCNDVFEREKVYEFDFAPIVDYINENAQH